MNSGQLLPADAFVNVRLGISVSPTEDLGRLGLLEDHFRVALAEIARAVFVLGGQIVFGGDLRPNSYTSYLTVQLRRHAVLKTGRPEPLQAYLAWQHHRNARLSELDRTVRMLGLYGRLVYVSIDGKVVDRAAGRGEEPEEVEASTAKLALRNLRLCMADQQDARVFIGGRRSGFTGYLPGLIEEVEIALSRSHPVFLAGGFGGVTMDIARAAGIDDGAWFPREDNITPGYHIIEAIARRQDWQGLGNGLTPTENVRLAVSHRPSEIAALVSLGLGRLVSRGVVPRPRGDAEQVTTSVRAPAAG